MAISRARKKELVEQYAAQFGQATNLFVVDYKGVSVPEVTELRARVRKSGASYMVAKNTLIRRVIDGTSLEEIKDYFQGPTAIAYGEDPVSLAKVLTDFSKEVPAIEFRGGLVDGQAVAASDIKAIASLPSRQELLAQLVFLLQSPITSFVRTLAALPRGLVVALDQVRQKKEAEA